MEPILVINIDKKKLVVTQANQVALASYSLSLEEKRLVGFLTSLIDRNDKDFKTYRIPVIELQRHLELKRKDFYTNIEKVADTLMQRVIRIKKQNGKWIKLGWVSKAEYKSKGEDDLEYACLELRFDPDMKPYLLQLKSQYFSYMLENVASLKSIYSIRFYEIFASYRRIGKVTLEVEDIKRKLQISDKYKRFKDFRKYVINHAQKELKEKTDLCFEYTEERRGRKVTDIHFTFRTQEKPEKITTEKETQTFLQLQAPVIPSLEQEPLPQQQATVLPITATQQEAEKVLIRNGVDQRMREKLIASYNAERIINNANIVKEKFEAGKVQALAGPTVQAIKEDWKPKPSPYELEQEAKKQAKIEAHKKRERDNEIIEGFKKEFHENKRVKIENVYNTQTNKEKEALIKEFEKTLKSMMLSEYKKRGFESTIIKSMFNSFIYEKFFRPEGDDFVKWAKINKGVDIVKDRSNIYVIK